MRWRRCPGRGGRTGSPPTSTGCSRRAGSTRRWSSPRRRSRRRAALGNPYWVAYTSWIVGLAWSKADPQRALETWDEAVAYIGVHDVRFFEGFMARDAALLHTSDGQLETALTLFGASIEAFLRAGAVAQLMITLASLPALFERLDRPAVAGTLLGAMAREPASFHHVPSLADLGAAAAGHAGRREAGAVGRNRRRDGSPGRRRRTRSTRSTWPGRHSPSRVSRAPWPA